jgi:hypothetical protein
MKLGIAMFAATIVLGSNPGPAYAKDPDLMSLSMEHFRDSATVKEDAQGDAVISTEKGFVEHTGPLRMVWKDEFLSGVVDKKTGQKSFRINAWIIYSGRWRSYQTASYQSNTGPQSVPADKIGAEAANCAVGDCTYTERLAFPIDEELLRRLAAQHTPGKPVLWTYRFVANTGPDFAGSVSNAEIAGLLAKVDEYTHSTPAIQAHVAGAALKLDLGISGIPVAGGANHPNRAGVLITGVDGGSVAEVSGIIVGDILFEFDAHPIKALAELQAAVAACGANCAATIKLYRGLETVSVTTR